MAKKKKMKSTVTGRRGKGYRTINGERYHYSTYHDTKTAANARAKRVRNSPTGPQKARVVKHGSKHAVLVGGFKRKRRG